MNAFASMDTMELGRTLKRFAKDERHFVVDFLFHLKEFDDRRGYERFHCRSLFEFCRRELGLLECASFQRTTAVKILREIPLAAEYLRDGRLALSTLVDLRNVLDAGDPRALFDECSHKNREEVRKIVARLAPVEGPQTSLRKLPSLPVEIRDARIDTPEPVTDDEAPSVTPQDDVVAEPHPPAPPLVLVAPLNQRRLGITVKPVNACDYSLHATVDQDFVDLLDRVKNLYSHSFPGGDLVEVVRHALQIAADEKVRKKAAKTHSPRASSAATDDDTIPANVRRAVWDRDEGCCAWTYPDGRVCRSRWRVEFDHIVARGRGGKSTIENLRLTCREHNQQHARETYGDRSEREERGAPRPAGFPRARTGDRYMEAKRTGR